MLFYVTIGLLILNISVSVFELAIDQGLSAYLRSSGSSRRGVLVLDLQDVLEVTLLDHVLRVLLQTLKLDDHVVVDGAGDAAPGVGHEVAVNDEVRGARLHLPQLNQNKVDRLPEYFK